MKTYAQNKEDLILWDYFKKKGVKEGTFLDVGANDGITLSNTYLFALNGWHGVFVEPNAKAYQSLIENIMRIDDHSGDPGLFEFHNVAIAESQGYETLHASGEHLGKGDTGLLSTLVPSEMDRWKGTETFTAETVRTCRIEDLKIEGPVDLISIDCEGMDFEVLKQIPFEEWNVQAICIEYNNDEDLDRKISKYLFKRKFKFLDQNFENLIFVK